MMKNSVRLLAGFALALLTHRGVQAQVAATSVSPPNIVFVLADDPGWGDPKCNHPESKIPTPHIDQLAAQGTRFTHAHSAGSTCAPSRFGLMTGRSPTCWKYYDVGGEAWNCLTLPEMIRRSGYVTACIGKWHFTAQFPDKNGNYGKCNGRTVPKDADLSKPCRLGPVDRGFDYFFGTLAQPAGWHCNIENNTLVGDFTVNKKGFPVGDDFDLQRWFEQATQKTVEKIQSYAADGTKPFFVYYAMNAPHHPIIPGERFTGKSNAGVYGDYCCQVDWLFGTILQAIDDTGVADNTVVIFSSDNGSYAALPGTLGVCDGTSVATRPGMYDTSATSLNGHRPSGPWRGAKADIWEGGHRVPYLVRWPGHTIPGTVCDAPVSLMDHIATFAAIVNYPLTEQDGLNSWNILPLWEGTVPEGFAETRPLIQYANSAHALLQGRWKIIPGNLGSGGFSVPAKVAPESGYGGQLYDFVADPSESKNLWLDEPERVQKLTELLEQHMNLNRAARNLFLNGPQTSGSVLPESSQP